MPITRETFQVSKLSDEDSLADELAETPDTEKAPSIDDSPAPLDRADIEFQAELSNDSNSSDAQNASEKEGSEEVRKEGPHNLPPADPTSAEKKEAFGAAHPQRETHRSVATGRDVPHFTTSSQQHERMEFNWDEARAQKEFYEGRARAQKDAATDHLTRIHDVVGLLIEMSEAHANDARTKLQSLESKVAELETRVSLNRLSP